MKDRRLAAVVRAIEERFPGAKVHVEPWACPEGDHSCRWWLSTPGVRRSRAREIHAFALELGDRLYGWKRVPFRFSSLGPWNTRAWLEKRRAERAGRGRSVRRRSRGSGRRRAG